MMDNHTPGTTPLDDYSDLKIGWVKNRSQLDAVEAESINQALTKYLHSKIYVFPNWYSVENINRMHKEMFQKVWAWAGKYRQTAKTIGIESYRISTEMRTLQDDLKFWTTSESTLNTIEIVSRVHHRLVWIHPYENGNGRLARLVADMILRSLGYTYPQWPVSSGKNRTAYLKTLKEADQGNFSLLEDFIVHCGALRNG